jgi:cysteine desulfurase family protein (TIGR01976 family)
VKNEISRARSQAFPVEALRTQFPALKHPLMFFDNGAGAQVPRQALDAMNQHLLNFNVQRGGRYPMSIELDRNIAEARAKVAALLNASDAREVCFGMNATSFIRLVSLAIGETLKPGRCEIVVTDMDHDANVATWIALEPRGASIRWWKMRDDGRLHVADLLSVLSERTRLVACTAASHALGSLVDVAAVAESAHAVGAEVFLDCVHRTPHAPIDVQAWDCDYLVCSGYKAFAPHMGFLWGKFDKLVALRTFREEFIPDEPPFKIEVGTFVYENVSGMSAVVDYLETVGVLMGAPESAERRVKLTTAMNAIQEYERSLSQHMLSVLGSAGATVHGIIDPTDVRGRVPTFCFTLDPIHPQAIVDDAAKAGIAMRSGHMYAPRLIARLGLAMERGAVRVSLVHYNTHAEVERFAGFLHESKWDLR